MFYDILLISARLISCLIIFRVYIKDNSLKRLTKIAVQVEWLIHTFTLSAHSRAYFRPVPERLVEGHHEQRGVLATIGVEVLL